MELTEITKKKNLLFDGKILKLYRDDISLPNGEDAIREYVAHSGGVAVLPIDNQGNVYFVRQYRYAYAEEVLEIPAGKKELGEDPRECGIRELSEEIGASAASFVPLAEMYPSPGYTNEVINIFLATGLTFSEMHLDEDEFLSVEKYPIAKAMEMVASGEIKDGKSVIALLKYAYISK